MSMVRIAEAAEGGPAEKVPLDAFLARCEPYFERGGRIIDQPFQERLGDGMIRCYMAADRAAGFAGMERLTGVVFVACAREGEPQKTQNDTEKRKNKNRTRLTRFSGFTRFLSQSFSITLCL